MSADVLRALAVIAEPPTEAHSRIADALGLPGPGDAEAYTHVFRFQLYPYASVYLGADGMLGGEPRDRVAGFFRAVGAVPVPEPDHLTSLLAAYADAVEREDHGNARRAPAWRRVRRALLHEHLLSWLPAYTHALQTLAVEPYTGWARLLANVLHDEAAALPPPADPSAHLRAAPALPDPRNATVADFVGGLLAPARTGMIVTATTLARAAAELDLPLRIGERRFVLRGLFDADAAAVLRWLATFARTWSAAAATWAWAGPSAASWRDRAQATAALLDDLGAEAHVLTGAAVR